MAVKANRERDIKITFYVKQRELEFIKKKMAIAKIKNMSGYIRKMACDGYILNVNFDDFKELFAKIGRISGNVNQIAKRVNSTNKLYQDDVDEIKSRMEDVWRLVNSLLSEIKKAG